MYHAPASPFPACTRGPATGAVKILSGSRSVLTDFVLAAWPFNRSSSEGACDLLPGNHHAHCHHDADDFLQLLIVVSVRRATPRRRRIQLRRSLLPLHRRRPRSAAASAAAAAAAADNDECGHFNSSFLVYAGCRSRHHVQPLGLVCHHLATDWTRWPDSSSCSHGGGGGGVGADDVGVCVSSPSGYRRKADVDVDSGGDSRTSICRDSIST